MTHMSTALIAAALSALLAWLCIGESGGDNNE